MHERVFKRSAFPAACVMAVVVQAWAQAPPSSTPPAALAVNGDVGTTLSLTPADLKSLPRTRVEVKDDGRTLTYEGVLVGEILKRAGVPLGAELRGDAMATYVVASATDGYQVVFSIGERDPGFTSNDIIVADTIDGKPLFGIRGRCASWRRRTDALRGSIRMLTRLEVVRLKKGR